LSKVKKKKKREEEREKEKEKETEHRIQVLKGDLELDLTIDCSVNNYLIFFFF